MLSAKGEHPMSSTPDLGVLESMPALEASTEDLKQAAVKAIEPPTPEKKKEEAAKLDPRTKTVYPFSFEWIDKNGKMWRGKFQNTRLTIRQQQAMGVVQAQLGGGVPYDSLDPMTREINLMIAHMAFSLDPEIRPDWAKELRDLDSVSLLQALYQEVALHEAIFHGLHPAEEGSKSGG
jgi:hypothetical protein